MSKKNQVDAEKKGDAASKNRVSQLIIIALVAALVVFISRDPGRFVNILLVLAGFGAVIFVHELGHFTAAKSVGILVEAFAIGFGPVFIGVKRIDGGYRVSVLPGLIPGKDDRGAFGFVIPSASAKAGETDYQIRLIPLGGFVKMLGQDDTGVDAISDNPRSFGNTPAFQRAIVIAAGVIMNLISGAIIFMIVFAHGVELPPAVVGDVKPGSPAERAGFRGGDTIVAINGESSKNLSILELTISAAFADTDETVNYTVEHVDGTQETLTALPEMDEVTGIKMLGIVYPTTLTVAKLEEGPMLKKLAKLGFAPGDEIMAVNGHPISRYDQLAAYLRPKASMPGPDNITLTVQRADDTKHDINIKMDFVPAGTEAGKLLGMVPRLKILAVVDKSPAQKGGLKENDVIIRMDTISNPSFKELNDIISTHLGKPVELLIARLEDGKTVEKTVTVTPANRSRTFKEIITFQKAKPFIGIVPNLANITEPIVAKCGEYGDEQPALVIPRGASIVSIADCKISNWEDMIITLNKNRGSQVAIDYRTAKDGPVQSLSVAIPDDSKWIGFARRGDFGELATLPLKPMTKMFTGANWRENLQMGYDMTYSFIAQTYLMIRGMVKGTVSPKAASGPVGILKMSYTVVSQRSITYYAYFMAMISVCIAVFNFLPLPVLDGGAFVLLIIEKIKGSPVPMKIQEIITYAGLALIGVFFLYVTFQDIVKLCTGQL